MSKVFGKEPSMNLYKTILELKDLDECYRFFQDLCTVSEPVSYTHLDVYKRQEDYTDLTDLYNKTRTQGFGSEVKRRILLGTFVLSTGYYDAYYKKAMQVKALIKDAFDKAFEQYDLMLMPVAPATAPKLGASLSDPLQMYLSDIYTVSVNLAGLPGISVPCGFDRNGMPIGAQLIGPALGEAKVLGAAHAYQLDTDWHQRVPKGGTAV